MTPTSSSCFRAVTSRKFVELHGGKISVMSELGATFTFTVPLSRRSGHVIGHAT